MWQWQRPYRKSGDVEGGTAPLYPMMLESPQLRWAFIRKIYSILTVQLLLTVAVAAVVVTVRPISLFFASTTAGLVLYIFIILLPFILLCPLYFYHQRHPVNLLLLGLFTVSMSFLIGLTCAFTSGKVILEAAILTAAMVVSLTLTHSGQQDEARTSGFSVRSCLAPLFILIIFGFIQAFFPLGKITTMIYGALAAIIFCGYIVYDTDNLIKRYTYDDYIWAAVALYLDIINLFLSLLTLFRASDS